MLDSLRKRCGFVQGAMASMGITNAETLWGRAETLGQDAAHRETYDLAVARAVADMRVLLFIEPLLHCLTATHGNNSL